MSPREAELTEQLEAAAPGQIRFASAQENQLLREKVNLFVAPSLWCQQRKDGCRAASTLAGGRRTGGSPPRSRRRKSAQAQSAESRLARKPKTPRLPETLPVVEEVIVTPSRSKQLRSNFDRLARKSVSSSITNRRVIFAGAWCGARMFPKPEPTETLR